MPGLRSSAQSEPIRWSNSTARPWTIIVWAEGYIVRGPNAGTLMTAAIPYSTQRLKADTKKVFEGPYPEVSGLRPDDPGSMRLAFLPPLVLLSSLSVRVNDSSEIGNVSLGESKMA